MSTFLAILLSSWMLGNVNISIPEEKLEYKVQYVYAEAPATKGSQDDLSYGGKTVTRRGIILPPIPIKKLTIIDTIKVIFPPIDLSERG